MRIVMEGTHRGSDNGHSVRIFEQGEVYDTRSSGKHYISDSVACAFIRNGWAHEQTWDEWSENLSKRRQAIIESESDPIKRSFLEMVDNSCKVAEVLLGEISSPRKRAPREHIVTNPATLIEVNKLDAQEGL